MFLKRRTTTIRKIYLNFIHPGFCDHINNYELGEKKTLICYLLKLGITNSTAIAEAAALSPESIGKYKKDITTKICSDNDELNLESSINQNLGKVKMQLEV